MEGPRSGCDECSSVSGMQRPLRLLAAIAAAPLALAGCVPGSEPAPTPSPTPAATAVFASEEEALAAAEEVYAAFLATYDQVLQDGGEDPERLREHMTEETFGQELPSIEVFRENGYRAVGQSSFDLQLQGYRTSGSVSVYVCEDISGTDILDESGASIVSSPRTEVLPYEVSLAGDPLKITKREIWVETNVCGLP